MTTTSKHNPALSILKLRTTRQLVQDFLVTTSKPFTLELATVRGWIMDELERRNPDAYWAWLDQDNPTDESILEYFPA